MVILQTAYSQIANHTLLVAWLVNVATCLIFRLCHAGKMNIVVLHHKPGIKIWRFYIAGMMNQPDNAFRQIRNLNFGNTVLLKFSPFGWDPKKAAKQLETMLKPENENLCYSISVGDKVFRHLNPEIERKEYVINPCSQAGLLQAKYRHLGKLAAVLEAISILVGWFAIMPIAPVGRDGNRRVIWYSLILLADQLWHISGRIPPYHTEHVKGVIKSEDDEFLNNSYIDLYFHGKSSITIPTKHARTTDPYEPAENKPSEKVKPAETEPKTAYLYERALEKLENGGGCKIFNFEERGRKSWLAI